MKWPTIVISTCTPQISCFNLAKGEYETIHKHLLIDRETLLFAIIKQIFYP